MSKLTLGELKKFLENLPDDTIIEAVESYNVAYDYSTRIVGCELPELKTDEAGRIYQIGGKCIEFSSGLESDGKYYPPRLTFGEC